MNRQDGSGQKRFGYRAVHRGDGHSAQPETMNGNGSNPKPIVAQVRTGSYVHQ